MPCGDGSGPAGIGPMSGRRLGYCAGYSKQGSRTGFGHGHRRRLGCGFGYGVPHITEYHRPYRPPVNSAREETAYLKNIAKSLEDELKAVHDRLDELKNDQADEQE